MSTVLDFIASTVNREMKELFVIEAKADAVSVTTQCMYPSNGLVRVTIRGDHDSGYGRRRDWAAALFKQWGVRFK